VLPRASLLFGVLAAACFSEAPQDPTTSGSETGQPTTTADTTAGDDPVAACRECQATQCEGYTQSCMGTADCSICVEEPFDLACLTNDAFRPLAFCSCEGCGPECGYMCPGGGNACESCVMDNCSLGGCTTSDCLLCLQDPYGEGCATNEAFQAVQTCACEQCEAPCLWQCESAVDTCSACLTPGGDCAAAFGNCLGDPECDACFANPSNPGCGENMLFAALGVCVCGNCSSECGLLFGCA
jgi:hypothetical protein